MKCKALLKGLISFPALLYNVIRIVSSFAKRVPLFFMLLVKSNSLSTVRPSHKWPLSLCSQLHDEVQMVGAFIDVLERDNVLMLDSVERK